MLRTFKSEQSKFVRLDGRLSRGEWFYIYRWGVSDTHISGITPLLLKEGGYHYIGDLAFVEGTFELKPQWRLPSHGLTAELAASSATSILQREDLVRPFNIKLKPKA